MYFLNLFLFHYCIDISPTCMNVHLESMKYRMKHASRVHDVKFEHTNACTICVINTKAK